MKPGTTVLVLLALVAAVSSAGLLETLLSWELPGDSVGRSTTPQSKCLCQTSGCLCCVDLNLTATIDLGGPACVNIKQRAEFVTLNLSYGDNPVHNATTTIADAANKPTCMNLLSDLAQICAKFTSVKRSDAGYDGCLVIQPALLSTPQATYNIGCFNFNQGLVRQIETARVPEPSETTPEPVEEEEEGINTDELIAAVSASAEHGIALFSQWLGLNLNPKLNLTRPQEANSTSSRSSRMMKPEDGKTPEERSEERFKRILSAQDNVQKESARIGQSLGAQTTFVYSSPAGGHTKAASAVASQEVEKIPRHLTVVSKESRRGGRAYPIHQHVNEI